AGYRGHDHQHPAGHQPQHELMPRRRDLARPEHAERQPGQEQPERREQRALAGQELAHGRGAGYQAAEPGGHDEELKGRGGESEHDEHGGQPDRDPEGDAAGHQRDEAERRERRDAIRRANGDQRADHDGTAGRARDHARDVAVRCDQRVHRRRPNWSTTTAAATPSTTPAISAAATIRQFERRALAIVGAPAACEKFGSKPFTTASSESTFSGSHFGPDLSWTISPFAWRPRLWRRSARAAAA